MMTLQTPIRIPRIDQLRPLHGTQIAGLKQWRKLVGGKLFRFLKTIQRDNLILRTVVLSSARVDVSSVLDIVPSLHLIPTRKNTIILSFPSSSYLLSFLPLPLTTPQNPFFPFSFLLFFSWVKLIYHSGTLFPHQTVCTYVIN